MPLKTIRELADNEGLGFLLDPSLVLYLPLYKKDGSSFMSDDAYGHLATVTGALWTPQGHSFDGTDDYISLGNLSQLNFGTGDFSFIIWAKVNSGVTAGSIIQKENTNTGLAGYSAYIRTSDPYLRFYVEGSLSAKSRYTASFPTDIRDSRWHCFGTIWDGTADKLLTLLDGNLVDTDTTGGGQAVDSISNAIAFEIGRDGNTIGSPQSYLNGAVSVVIGYNRMITLAEYQGIYEATEWRYR